jgi:pyrroline-5-carboxylate reductase
MGEAILKGLIESSFIRPEKIGFYEKDISRREYVSSNYGIAAADNICSSVRDSRYLVMAVKPQNISSVVADISGCFNEGQNCIISIVAGISTGFYERNLGQEVSVIRVMPNTPALYKKGMITISPGKYAGKDEVAFVLGLMEKIGDCMIIDERLQHISTAINGSGPAYFFLFCQALIEAASANGIDRDIAKKLVTGTIIGAGEMLSRSQLEIDDLISRVASPGGTTEKALETFRDRKLKQAVKEAVENAFKKSKELEKEMT